MNYNDLKTFIFLFAETERYECQETTKPHLSTNGGAIKRVLRSSY